jgi:hypothetical protein
MKDHIFSEIDQKLHCLYCNSENDGKWSKQHHDSHLYDTHVCQCGAENRITTHDHGSGHDDTGVNEGETAGTIIELENIVSKIQNQIKK